MKIYKDMRNKIKKKGDIIMKVLNKVLGYIIAVIVAIMVLACCWQVITRFILDNPSKYTEEFLRYSLIWLTMLGAPYAYGQEKHLSINVVTKNFQKTNLVITKIGIEIIVMLLSLSVLVVGGIIVTSNSSGQISPAMQIPMQVYYMCVPISGILMIVYCVERFIKYVKQIKEVK